MAELDLTAVECWGAVDISCHERRFCLLPNCVIPHPADATLEEGEKCSELPYTDSKLNIETQQGDFVTQWGFCNQNRVACSNLQRTISKHAQTTLRHAALSRGHEGH